MSEDRTDNSTVYPGAVNSQPAEAFKSPRGKLMIGATLVAVLLLGTAAGAAIMKMRDNDERQALLPTVAISSMVDDSLVAVKGRAVEQFGNKFILADASGRTLIDTGPAGDEKALVKLDEEITVQGRFDDGSVKAAMVIHADGHVDELKPPHRHGPPDRPAKDRPEHGGGRDEGSRP